MTPDAANLANGVGPIRVAGAESSIPRPNGQALDLFPGASQSLSPGHPNSASVAAVAIGRNEGERLRRCLTSLASWPGPVAYVDSGSTDGSPELARALGAEVVALDCSVPFTAARARNAGFRRLLELEPRVEFVQFLDGDCELDPGWLGTALRTFADRPAVVAVCGRRRERFPEASVYNRLCDLEWDTPVGPAEATGGDALFRVEALRAAGGYRDDLIAGEEPELCLRLRAAGGRVERLDAEMTRHDAALTRFGQWWRRSVRAGHAYAEVSWLHRAERSRFWRRQALSGWCWGLLLPLAAFGLAVPTFGLSLFLLSGYVVLAWRVYSHRRRRAGRGEAALEAAFTIPGKVAQAVGQARFHSNRLLARRTRLIEYKQPAVPANGAP
jgi:cellulose synthase/poly-beta-1,6-N-acetylglucosamine synthase-like glycosyltransferase